MTPDVGKDSARFPACREGKHETCSASRWDGSWAWPILCLCPCHRIAGRIGG